MPTNNDMFHPIGLEPRPLLTTSSSEAGASAVGKAVDSPALVFDENYQSLILPGQINYGGMGGSIASRPFCFFDYTNANLRRENNQIIINNLPGTFAASEFFRVNSRKPGLWAPRQRPVLLNGATEMRLTPYYSDLPNVSAASGIANSGQLYALSRHDMCASLVRQAQQQSRNLAGRMRLVDSVAHGGDNWSEILVKRDVILELASRLAQVGGVMIGNMGESTAAYSDLSTGVPAPIQLVRDITSRGCRFIAYDTVAVATGTPTAADKAFRQRILYWNQFESDRNPYFWDLGAFQRQVSVTSADGLSISGVLVDNVHWNQAGTFLQGGASALASILNAWYPGKARSLRRYIGEQWTQNTRAPLGAQIFNGFWASSGSAAPTVTGGSGAVAGTCDTAIRIGRSGNCAITASETTSGGRKTSAFALVSAAAAIVEISMVGPVGALYFDQMSSLDRYEVAVDGAITGLSNVQSAEVYCDTGVTTQRLGAASSFESPEYQSFLTTSTFSQPEDGVFWFPELIQFPSTATQFRITFRISFSAAGTATVTIRDGTIEVNQVNAT